MEKENKVCQSCGMPLKKDKEGPAKEADGSICKKYCSHCYKDGEFVNKDLTLSEQIEMNEKFMKEELKLPKLLIKFFNRRIPQLERWNIKQDSNTNN